MPTKEEKRAYDRERYLRNAARVIARVAAWRAAHPDKALSYGRNWKSRNRPQTRKAGRDRYAGRKEQQAFYALGKKYGLSKTAYDNMYEAQQGVCALCGHPQANGSRLRVDHCHMSGRVRQLLCNKCNSGMGMLRESPDLLRKAAEYIERHRGL